MDAEALRSLLDDVASGRVDPASAARRLERLPFADLGYARIDHHRALRQGLPEAVYAPGKTPTECAAIVTELLEHGSGPVLLTRADAASTPIQEVDDDGEVVSPKRFETRGVDPAFRFEVPDDGRYRIMVRDVAAVLNLDERIDSYVVESENFESIHNHSAYALIEKDKRAR